MKENSEQPEKLGESEAHEEANMMNALLRKEGKDVFGLTENEMRRREMATAMLSGNTYERPKEVKPEDYDKALALVAEIKGAAEEEPGIKKALHKVGRLVRAFADLGFDAASGFDRSYGQHASMGGLTSGHYEGYVTPDFLLRFDDWLADAEKRLQDLKKAGAETAKIQTEAAGPLKKAEKSH
jgi:hypothetical protein